MFLPSIENVVWRRDALSPRIWESVSKFSFSGFKRTKIGNRVVVPHGVCVLFVVRRFSQIKTQDFGH